MTANLLQRLDAVDAAPGAAELRARTYELLDAAPGPVVDIGCGSGRAVAELHERGVRAIGLDPSEEMLAAARSRRPDLDFRPGIADSLPLADGECTGYRADKVFHLLPDPRPALHEARRVLAPGGRIVLLGQDWDLVAIDSDDPARTRELVHKRADGVASPRAARSYRNLLLDHGFTDVAVEVHTAIYTGPAAVPLLAGTGKTDEKWLAEQRRRAEQDRLFLAIPMFVASGTNPD
ncbi:methyltransferase domain-containing protein [Amycolatopsis acidicola]|uniref:Methyltransferase domain-containing protein n=1 Tax=Amycolatopsis acidicola TaxID=2596893 RepID=A0A5N0UT39_9PSEU|nr:methyltransferase domain-containing protein [Amycolatopsis acidicola]KAA9152883.1 methyltransferase domain-containing protein [Amycolatopsis acidicola]